MTSSPTTNAALEGISIGARDMLRKKGTFIVFEGIDGCGKTTQVNRAVAYLNDRFGLDEVAMTKDLGGSILGEELRKIMYGKVPPRFMASGVLDLVFLAGHVQNWHTLVKPWLAEGKIVVSDRWYLSQFAYGPYRGWDERVARLYDEMKGGWPDLVIFLYGDPVSLLERANARPDASTHQGQKAWNDAEKQGRICQRYFDMYSHLPGFCTINVDGMSEEQVWGEVKLVIDSTLREKQGA